MVTPDTPFCKTPSLDSPMPLASARDSVRRKAASFKSACGKSSQKSGGRLTDSQFSHLTSPTTATLSPLRRYPNSQAPFLQPRPSQQLDEQTAKHASKTHSPPRPPRQRLRTNPP